MRFILPVVVLAAVGLAPAQSRQPEADELVAKLQQRYSQVRDFTADFTQAYEGLLMRRATVERGKMLLKKPSRVRFTYERPEHKEFVADGSQFYSYFPEERAGSVYPLPKPGEESTALQFLAGRGDLRRDFVASLPADQPQDEWQLRLEPRKKDQADFETLTLLVDRRTLALHGFITTDDQGTSTIRFSNLKENTGLKDDAFLFRFPPGTEISR
jgi:outer membrane lipoprotein carrier protein